jgi:phosphopantetheinyl transferase
MNVQPLSLRGPSDERPAYFSVVDTAELQAPGTIPEAFLCESELAAYGALRFPRKREGFLIGRLAAKRALAAMLSEPDLRRIEIHSGAFGQPMVHHPRAGCTEVTLSHSHGLAVALAYPGAWPMGVDLETVSPASAGTIIAQLQLSPAEKAWLDAGLLDPDIACGVLWTAREALGKSMKIGLNCPLEILSLDRIEPVAAAAWLGGYAKFPHSHCLLQNVAGRVLSVAMPATTVLTPWPSLG